VTASKDAPTGGGSPVGASRRRILRTLQGSEHGLGVQELAEQVGLHANTVRFHLNRLLAEGLVRRHAGDHHEQGRPPLTFVAVESGYHGERRSYRLLAEMLASFMTETTEPHSKAAAVEAGRTWGHFLTQRPSPYRRTDDAESLEALTSVLEEIGFAPEVVQTQDAREVWLHHCPFLEVATSYRDVVCSLHLGLMQGVLAETRGPSTVDQLRPLVAPSLCVARLVPAL
jgi:predicted ArsR family transcriptional regulator